MNSFNEPCFNLQRRSVLIIIIKGSLQRVNALYGWSIDKVSWNPIADKQISDGGKIESFSFLCVPLLTAAFLICE